MRKEQVKLLDGTTVVGDYFDTSDFKVIQTVFQNWLSANKNLKNIGGRTLNVPDVISEALFCIAFDAVRTNNTAHSFDCVLRKTGQGVQVKSASIPTDCTSFGPKSKWDLLYFLDFVPNGTFDGNIDVYEIDGNEIYDLVLNKEKGETFRDQQKQGRRPRFSIQNRIIRVHNLKPVKKININTGVIS